jgi:N-acetylglucosamine kinase-like BadF-type ATPase
MPAASGEACEVTSMTTLVLGMDVGGTSSRAVVADLTGRVVGRGVSGGGNPISRGIGPAMAAIRSAIEEALRGVDGVAVDRNSVQGNVIGAAGFGAGTAHEPLAQVWRELGMPGEPVVAGDIEVAFASGTDELDGSVLIGGTGAVAGAIAGGETAGVADGFGWLLGDHGSGFWVGREAVRRAISPRADLTDPLFEQVAVRLTGRSEVDRLTFIAAAYAQEPVRLSELAGVVVAAADEGSAAALSVLESAADELVSTLAQVREEGEATVVVLGGGLLGSSRLRDLVTDRIEGRWPGSAVRHTGSGVGGAAWLAARSLGLDLPAGLHATLTAPEPTR